MSAVSSRSEVRKVPVLAPPETVVSGRILAAILETVASAAPSTDTIVRPESRVAPAPQRSSAARQERAGAHSPSRVAPKESEAAAVARVRANAAKVLADSMLPAGHGLEPVAHRLAVAQTLEAATIAGQELLATADAAHRDLLCTHLAAACTTAAAAAGFTMAATPQARGGVLRLICTDASGLALVNEIRMGSAGSASLETEVVGTRGRRCHDVLDRFDAALDAAGVRSAPPRRRGTGGVGTLQGARDFIRAEHPLLPAPAASGSESSPRQSTTSRRRLRQGNK